MAAYSVPQGRGVPAGVQRLQPHVRGLGWSPDEAAARPSIEVTRAEGKCTTSAYQAFSGD